MALTTALSGTVQLNTNFKSDYSGDRTGNEQIGDPISLAFAAAGGDAPTISGFFKGTATCAAGDWLLAHASDPLGSMGNAGYNQGFTVAGTKLKFFYVRNTDTTNSITIARKTSAGLPIFDADGDSVTLAPGDVFMFFKKAGTAALTTTTNDGLTISVSGGAPTCIVMAAYGP